jgi:hypothetical protein
MDQQIEQYKMLPVIDLCLQERQQLTEGLREPMYALRQPTDLRRSHSH